MLRPGRYSYHDGMKLTDLIASYHDLLARAGGALCRDRAAECTDFRPSVESFDLAAALANPATSPKLAAARYRPRIQPVRFRTGADGLGRRRSPHAGQIPHFGAGASAGRDLSGGRNLDRAGLESAQLFRTQSDGTMKIFSVNLGGALAGNPDG